MGRKAFNSSKQIRHNKDGSVTVTTRVRTYGTTNIYTERYNSLSEYHRVMKEQNKEITKRFALIALAPFKYIYWLPCKYLIWHPFKNTIKYVKALLYKQLNKNKNARKDDVHEQAC